MFCNQFWNIEEEGKRSLLLSKAWLPLPQRKAFK